MLDVLTKGFRNAQLKLRGQTRLTADALAPALREVRTSLLEADVQLDVAKAFLSRVQTRLEGQVVQLKDTSGQVGNLTAADHFVKACFDELVELMGPAEPDLDLEGKPSVIMMVGLQGSGKTTTTGKLAKQLVETGHKPLLVAADIYRPAAIDQLMVLGRQLDLPVFSIQGMKPVDLAKAAVAQARSVGRDVVLVDTAGRLAIDNALMDELVAMKAAIKPQEVLFVADAMIGQDAVATASTFDKRLDFTGFVLTKMDGDARGGAALSIKEVTGKPIKLIGVGEGMDKLEAFRPEGLAERILGFGDVVGLVKDFEKHADIKSVEKSAERMFAGKFTYEDFVEQIRTIRRMGPLRDLIAKMPFLSGALDQLPPEALDDRELDRTLAIISSMTRQERHQPDVLNASRLRRIAGGCGRSEAEVKALHDRFLQMRSMMSNLGGMMNQRGGGLAALSQMAGGGMGGLGGLLGGLPGMGGGADPKDNRPKMSAQERLERKKKRKQAEKTQRRNR